MALVYKRALLKLSGEALAGERGFGLDFGVIDRLADEIKDAMAMAENETSRTSNARMVTGRWLI